MKNILSALVFIIFGILAIGSTDSDDIQTNNEETQPPVTENTSPKVERTLNEECKDIELERVNIYNSTKSAIEVREYTEETNFIQKCYEVNDKANEMRAKRLQKVSISDRGEEILSKKYEEAGRVYEEAYSDMLNQLKAEGYDTKELEEDQNGTLSHIIKTGAKFRAGFGFDDNGASTSKWNSSETKQQTTGTSI